MLQPLEETDASHPTLSCCWKPYRSPAELRTGQSCSLTKALRTQLLAVPASTLRKLCTPTNPDTPKGEEVAKGQLTQSGCIAAGNLVNVLWLDSPLTHWWNNHWAGTRWSWVGPGPPAGFPAASPP